MAWTDLYVRADADAGGDGTTNAVSGANCAFRLADAISHSASNTGIRYNLYQGGGTFANTTTSRTFGGNGTTTAPNWWRGFNTTIGDCDLDPTLTKPSITFTTGRFIVTGTHQWFSSLDISGAHTQAASGQIAVSANGCRFFRVRCEATAANSASRAFVTGNSVALVDCWFKANAAATDVLQVTAGALFLEGCSIVGGTNGASASSGNIFARRCGFFAPSGDGIRVITTAPAAVMVVNCSFYQCGSDGIEFNVLTTTGTYVVTDCVFEDSGAYDINNSTGANTNFVFRANNTRYNNVGGTAHENGFGDSPNFNNNTDSSNPFTSSTDLTLVSGSNARAHALPGRFENQSFTSYADAGAVQHQDSGGGVVIIKRGGTVMKM
jgi:hypothetical protein